MSTEKKGGTTVFLILYPLITALITLLPWGFLLLPMLYAFILVKINNRTVANVVATASYVLSWAVMSVSLHAGLVATYVDSLIISGVVATAFFIMAMAYSAAARKRKGFWLNVCTSAGALLACGLAATAVLYFGFGGNVSRSIVSIFTRKFYQDIVLVFAQYNAIIADYSAITSTADIQDLIMGVVKADPKVLINGFTKEAQEFINAYMGSLMICMSIGLGLCLSWGTALLSRIKKFNFMENTFVKWDSRRVDFLPPYAMFYPKRVISSLIVALLVMWILNLMDVPSSETGINIVSAVLSFLFTLLGIFFTDFLLKRCKMRKGPRIALILLVAIPFLSGILPFLGMLDSLFGFRRRMFIIRPKQ